jgi:hypothetical protein
MLCECLFVILIVIFLCIPLPVKEMSMGISYVSPPPAAFTGIEKSARKSTTIISRRRDDLLKGHAMRDTQKERRV